MTDHVRRACGWLGLFVVTAAATVFVACGSSTGSNDTGTIGVETSDMFVTIENKAGLPLVDLRIEVVPYSGQSPFGTSIARLEGGEKREVSLGKFSSRDGTTLSLRIVKPHLVRVTATDVSGKAHRAEVNWR